MLVANRGLGLGEPAALGVAVGKAVGRRLRVAGAPGVPFLDALVRRLGSVHASSEDLARVCHAHPALQEVVKEAALAVDGRAIHA